MAQNVDYTLIRGTAIALSQYVAQTVGDTLAQDSSSVSTALSAALDKWDTDSKLSAQDKSGIISALSGSVVSLMSSSSMEDTLKTALLSWTAQKQSESIPLSTINADYESNRSELFNLIAQLPDPAFHNFLASGTGTQLIYAIATAQTMNQVGMELAIRENFVTLAQQSSSVYAGLTNQGIRLSRSTPAAATVSLKTTDPSLSIPPYEQFSINGVSYFNRDQIFWTPKLVNQSFGDSTQVIKSTDNLTVSAVLYEGTLTQKVVTSDGSPYILVECGNSDGRISDQDVIVFVNGEKWERAGSNLHWSMGLYNYQGTDKVWTEYTTAQGNCVVQFGNGSNGAIPPSGSTIAIFYVETDGSAGNSYNLSATVSASAYQALSGIVLDYAQGGTDPRDVTDYKAMAPSLFSSQARPCSLSDYPGYVCNYPGIIDSAWQGQQQFAPEDPSQAMVIRGVLLTESPWDDLEMTRFSDWLTGAGQDTTALIGANLYPQLYQAKEVPFDVQVQVFVKPYSNTNQIKSDITQNLANQYKARYGVINRKVAISDLEDVISESTSLGIDYFDVQLPAGDMDIPWDSYAVLNDVTIQISPTDRR